MMLVHKQQLPLSSPYAYHRRHPSAPPAVVVQPTKTPGLLSLSKPQRPQLQQPRQRSSPKPRPAQATRSPKQVPAAEAISVLKPSVEIVDKKQSPQAGSRGRQQSKPKDKPTTRSSSHSAVRGRRINSRQQSPPLPTSQSSSQAEAPPSPTYVSSNINLFDPFLDESTPIHSQSKTVRPTPTLTSRPSGKLARRRQPDLAPFNPISTPSRAIPVPRRFNAQASDLSRSDPVPTRKVGLKSTVDIFPICDDMTDFESEDDSTLPATPTRARTRGHYSKGFDDGPRTAPITSQAASFPFSAVSASSSVGRKAGRRHRRMPSEGVFAMSSDEELHNTPAKGPASDELKALFGLNFKRQSIKPSSYESDKEREAAAAAAYFASSNFQNSPSPEELPPPSFV